MPTQTAPTEATPAPPVHAEDILRVVQDFAAETDFSVADDFLVQLFAHYTTSRPFAVKDEVGKNHDVDKFLSLRDLLTELDALDPANFHQA